MPSVGGNDTKTKANVKGNVSVTFGDIPDGTDPDHPDFECPRQHRALSGAKVRGQVTVEIDKRRPSARVKMVGGVLDGQTTDFSLSWDGLASTESPVGEDPTTLTITNPWLYVTNLLGSGACLDSLTGRTFTVSICTASDCLR